MLCAVCKKSWQPGNMVALIYGESLIVYVHISDIGFDRLAQRPNLITEPGKYLAIEVRKVSPSVTDPLEHWNTWQPLGSLLVNDPDLAYRYTTNNHLGRLRGKLDEQLLDRLTGNIPEDPKLVVVGIRQGAEVTVAAR